MEQDLDILLLHGLSSLPFGSSMGAVLERFGKPAEGQTEEQLKELWQRETPLGQGFEFPRPKMPPLDWEYPEINVGFKYIDGSYRLVRFDVEYGSQFRLFGLPLGEPRDDTFIPMIESHGIDVLRAHRMSKDVFYLCSHGVDFYTNVGDVMMFGWSILDYRLGLEELDRPAYDRLRSAM